MEHYIKTFVAVVMLFPALLLSSSFSGSSCTSLHSSPDDRLTSGIGVQLYCFMISSMSRAVTALQFFQSIHLLFIFTINRLFHKVSNIHNFLKPKVASSDGFFCLNNSPKLFVYYHK